MQGFLFVIRWSCVRPGEAGLATARKDETKHCLELVAGSPGGAPEMAIQVYADLSDPSTLEREERALIHLADHSSYGTEPLLITFQDVPPGEKSMVERLRQQPCIFTLIAVVQPFKVAFPVWFRLVRVSPLQVKSRES